ncbi:MAG: NAD-dependent epimerase/dehydratase family protein [Alphaproteobacteria bacterium]|nr:MAG: NAD-dependent epimerase/dehydratase family protein [Alphaproteobacteria bacterium]
MGTNLASTKVLLLGYTGYIGATLAKVLLEKNIQVVCPVRNKKPHKKKENIVFVEMSQIESFLKTSKVKPTTVISCIASRKGGVTDSWDVEYTLNKFFLNLCKRVGINRFILLSAICVQKPTLEFQKAKLAFENLLKHSTLEYEIIRPTAFFKSLSGQIDRVKKGKSFLVFGNGELTTCKPISARDLSEFIIGFVLRKRAENKIHLVGGPGPPISPKNQAELLFKLSKNEKKITHISPNLFLVIIYVLMPLSKISKKIQDFREFLKIAYYYATESMLFWDEKNHAYSSDKTPEFGKDTLEDYYKKILDKDIVYKELKDQKLF